MELLILIHKSMPSDVLEDMTTLEKTIYNLKKYYLGYIILIIKLS